MKKYIILLLGLAGMYSCSQSREDLKPVNVAHSGAKRAPEVSVEDWGGLTMTVVSIDSSNKSARDTTWGTVWCGVPVKFRHMSYAYSRSYAVAWGELANYQELHDMSVSPNSNGSDGMFSLYQSTTGPDPYGGSITGPRVPLDATSVIGQIQWTDDAYYFGTIRPGIKQNVIDVLNDLKDHYQAEADARSLQSEVNSWINNLNADRAGSSVVKPVDEYTLMILGRVVKKPNGTYGIVPPLWIPPLG